MLINLTVKGFIDELASTSPAPGGGSVAALAGALSCALVAMVAGLTKAEADGAEGLAAVKEQAEGLQARLAALVDEDTAAFNRVMAAYKLPKATEAEKAARSEAIQAALKGAALLPLEVARLCLQALELAEAAVERGNPNALSDAGVAGLVALAGLKGALYNVAINLGAIKDEAFVRGQAAAKDELLAVGERLAAAVEGLVWQRLG